MNCFGKAENARAPDIRCPFLSIALVVIPPNWALFIGHLICYYKNEKWEKNDLKRELKSENEPKINNGNVFVIVGKTFEKEVINNDKDVILLFYAPWCTHCKELSPKYEEVGKILKKNNPKLLVAKIDGSQNEVESIDIPAFPTILFFPGNQKKRSPIEYKGKRNTDDIIEFIMKY